MMKKAAVVVGDTNATAVGTSSLSEECTFGAPVLYVCALIPSKLF
jgi:hypothetical protein